MSVRYLIKDARNLREVVGKNKIDVVVTSPPYWDLKDYGIEGQIGLGQKYIDYLNDLEYVFRQAYVVTKETGSLWIVIDNLKKGKELITLPFDLMERLKKIGWIPQDIIIWEKDKTVPWSNKGSFRSIFEYILFFSKDKGRYKYYIDQIREPENLKQWWISHPERYNPRGKVPTGIWRFNLITQGWGKNWVKHACPFPRELVERILLLTTREGDMVLDPFAGSGMVLAEAKAMNRRALGLDLNPKFKEMYETELLHALLKMNRDLLKSGENLQAKQSLKETQIWDLRKLKYARELIRLAIRKIGPELRSQLDFIVVEEPPRKRNSAKISIILKKGNEVRSDILRVLEEIGKNDLRNFVGNYETRVLKREEFFYPRKVLYRYVGGAFHHHKGIVSIKEYQSGTGKLPDIISPIKIEISTTLVQ